MNDSERRFVPTRFARMITVDNHAVLLDLHAGQMLGLNPIASRMWTLLTSNKALPSIVHELQNIYEVDTSQLTADLLRFLQEVKARQLLQEVNCPDNIHQAEVLYTRQFPKRIQLTEKIMTCLVNRSRPFQALLWIEAWLTLKYVDHLFRSGSDGFDSLVLMLDTMQVNNQVTAADSIIERLTQTVRTAALWHSFQTACLHQCLTLCWMLRRRNIQADLVIGVYTHPFSAHAWVEGGDKIIQWQAGMEQYADVTRLKAMSIIFHTGKIGGKD